MAELLSKIVGFAKPALDALLQIVLSNTSSPNLSGLANLVHMIWDALQTITEEILTVRTVDKWFAEAIGNDIDDIGGAVETIGENQRAIWHHVRYILMPNTIQLIWDWVWQSWIAPLRANVGVLISWDVDWHGWIRYWILESLAWAHAIIATQREWRAKYVYPQLQWLMSPQRVAYFYVQAFLAEMAQYLSFVGHTHDRDAFTRVVIDNSPRLWRHTERAMLAFLNQPIDNTGYGDSLPQRPPWATQPPPPVPPQWEPWITTPNFSYAPPSEPGLPEQQPSYNGGRATTIATQPAPTRNANAIKLTPAAAPPAGKKATGRPWQTRR